MINVKKGLNYFAWVRVVFSRNWNIVDFCMKGYRISESFNNIKQSRKNVCGFLSILLIVIVSFVTKYSKKIKTFLLATIHVLNPTGFIKSNNSQEIHKNIEHKETKTNNLKILFEDNKQRCNELKFPLIKSK